MIQISIKWFIASPVLYIGSAGAYDLFYYFHYGISRFEQFSAGSCAIVGFVIAQYLCFKK